MRHEGVWRTRQVGEMADAWVLGSMGWMPSRGQQTACVLVEQDDELILLDAGTGVANLAAYSHVLGRHGRLSIILSHYHLDHVVGLMYLNRFVANMSVDVYGPGEPAYPCGTQKYLSDLLQPALYSLGPVGFAREVRCFDYAGEDFAVGNVRVQVRSQDHSAPSFELRLGDAIAYATDTCFDADAWAEYPQTSVLLHECWQSNDGDARHSSTSSLVAGLPNDTFGKVVLIHQNPSWSEQERARVATSAASRGFELAFDGMHLEL